MTRDEKQAVVLSAGLGMYWAWAFALFFSGSIQLPQWEGGPDSYLIAMTSMGSMLVVMFLAAFVIRGAFARMPLAARGLFPLMGAVGTLMLGSPNLDAVVAGAVVTGIGSGFLLLGWGLVFSECEGAVSVRGLIVALLTSALVFGVTAFAPEGTTLLLLACLPPASYICIDRLYRITPNPSADPVRPQSDSPGAENPVRYPLQLGIGLAAGAAAIGLTLGGVMHDGRLQPMTVGLGISLDHVLVAGILIIAVAMHKQDTLNFDAGNALVAPLVAASVFLGLFSSGSLLILAFVLSRVSFDVLDCLLWIRLPHLAGRGSYNIAVFGFLRLMLDGGVFLGLLAARLLSQTQTVPAIAFSLTVVVLLLVMTFALNSHSKQDASIGHVPRQEDAASAPLREDRFEQACAAIARQYRLTSRETTILTYLARGRVTSYIQKELVISEGTVRTHTKRIYAKTGVHSRQELMTMVENAQKDHLIE